jgi:hypothetical protein
MAKTRQFRQTQYLLLINIAKDPPRTKSYNHSTAKSTPNYLRKSVTRIEHESCITNLVDESLCGGVDHLSDTRNEDLSPSFMLPTKLTQL